MKMGRTVSRWTRVIAVGLLALGLAARPAAQSRTWTAEQVDRETKTLQLGATGSLELRNIAGDITVTSGSGRDVTIEIVRRSRGRTDADAKLGLSQVTVQVDQRGERATVQVHAPDVQRPVYSVSTTYTVTAPVGTHLTAGSVAGTVTIKGIRGDVSASVISGDINISSVGRISTISAISGNVSVTGADSESDVSVSAVSGNVSLQQIKARRVAVSVTSGSVTARDMTCDGAELSSMVGAVEYAGALTSNGRYQLRTHSGQVRFFPTGSIGFELQSNTFSGMIQVDLPIAVQNSLSRRGPMRSFRGTFGDGSAVVIATTFSGNVLIGKK
jgi:DUF4097 and DUF4098 domain-containing protein YvlB